MHERWATWWWRWTWRIIKYLCRTSIHSKTAISCIITALQRTSEALPAQLPLLDEAGEHLRLHEHLQEPLQALGRDGFAEGFSLKGRRRGGRGAGQGGGGDGVVLSVRSAHEEGIVTHHLHEEAHKGLWHRGAEGAGVWVVKRRGTVIDDTTPSRSATFIMWHFQPHCSRNPKNPRRQKNACFNSFKHSLTIRSAKDKVGTALVSVPCSRSLTAMSFL